MRARRSAAAIASLATICMLGAVGCGGSGAKTSTGPGATSASSASLNVKPKTIGILSISRSSAATLKTEQAVTLAAQKLGWQTQVIDANADPDKAAKGIQTFVSQGVDGIIGLTVEASIARRGLMDARSKSIPTCEAGTVAPNDQWDASYVDDNVLLGQMLMDYLTQNVPNARIADLLATQNSAGRDRQQGVMQSLQANPHGAQIVAQSEPDITNPVSGTEKTLSDMFTAHPDTNAVYAVYDNYAPGALTAVRNQRSKAKVFTYYGTPTNVKALRSDPGMGAILDANLATTGLLCVDQFLAKFQKNTPIDPQALAKRGGLQHQIVTPQNVEQATHGGDATFPNEELLKPFLDSWSKEYK